MMHHLVLIKSLSYWGKVKADKDHPDVFVPDGPAYEAAMESGYFKEVGNEQPADLDFEEEKGIEAEETVQAPDDLATELSQMTVSELRAYAGIKGIPLDANMKKTEILEAITAAEDKADQIRQSIRAEAEV